MTKILTSSALIAAISGTLIFAAPVSAAPASVDAAPTFRVDLHGIDLASDDGLKLARRKLQAAARRVCPTISDQQDLQQISAQRACYKKAINTAYAQLDQIHLAQIKDHSGNQTAMVAQNPALPSGH